VQNAKWIPILAGMFPSSAGAFQFSPLKGVSVLCKNLSKFIVFVMVMASVPQLWFWEFVQLTFR